MFSSFLSGGLEELRLLQHFLGEIVPRFLG